jgi:hypothetical protein
MKKKIIERDLNDHIGTTRRGLREYMRIMDITNRIKRENKS